MYKLNFVLIFPHFYSSIYFYKHTEAWVILCVYSFMNSNRIEYEKHVFSQAEGSIHPSQAQRMSWQIRDVLAALKEQVHNMTGELNTASYNVVLKQH